MLRTDTVEPILISTLKQLISIDYLQNFHLVGGTGLALQLGHRNSVDIDLFTFLEFNSYELSQKLEIIPQLHIKTDWRKIKDFIRSKVNQFIRS